MNTWAKSFSQYEATIRSQMAAAIDLAQSSGISVEAAIAPYLDMLRGAYSRDIQLVEVMDESDLVVKFNGPAVDDGILPADIVANVISDLHGHITALSKSIIGLAGFDSKDRLPDQLDPRLVGLAKGSLIIGLKMPNAADPQGQRQLSIHETIMPVIASVRSTVKKLPSIAGYVEDDKISSGIRTRVPDPAERDALIVAASRIAPSGQRGITKVQMLGGTSKKTPAVLTPHSRRVLRQAVNSPIAPTKFGHFRGVVRAADLDAHRFEIRNVESFGSIRCIYKPEMQAQIKRCFDHLTEVTGHYESGANGAPRLLIVEKVKALKRQHLDDPLPFYGSQ